MFSTQIMVNVCSRDDVSTEAAEIGVEAFTA